MHIESDFEPLLKFTKVIVTLVAVVMVRERSQRMRNWLPDIVVHDFDRGTGVGRTSITLFGFSSISNIGVTITLGGTKPELRGILMTY